MYVDEYVEYEESKKFKGSKGLNTIQEEAGRKAKGKRDVKPEE